MNISKTFSQAFAEFVTKCLHTLSIQERRLKQLLPNLPPPSPEHLQSLGHAVENSFREQSAVAQGQVEVRKRIAAELQSVVQQSFPGTYVSTELNICFILPGLALWHMDGSYNPVNMAPI